MLGACETALRRFEWSAQADLAIVARDFSGCGGPLPFVEEGAPTAPAGIPMPPPPPRDPPGNYIWRILQTDG